MGREREKKRCLSIFFLFSPPFFHDIAIHPHTVTSPSPSHHHPHPHTLTHTLTHTHTHTHSSHASNSLMLPHAMPPPLLGVAGHTPLRSGHLTFYPGPPPLWVYYSGWVGVYTDGVIG